MGLEAGEFISDLVTNWPLPTDKRREGDDHLRLIKRAVKNTFPNMNGACNVTPQKLNNLPNNMSGLVTELRRHVVPMRAIVAFSGTEEQVPAGWVLCNGQTVTGFGAVPDLRARFILGANVTYPAGTSGGAASGNTGTSGGHIHAVQEVALTVAQLPPHNHRVLGSSAGGGDIDPLNSTDSAFAGTQDGTNALLGANASGTVLVENTGSGQGHSHGMSTSGEHLHTVSTLPPYYSLAYIIKVIDWVEPL